MPEPRKPFPFPSWVMFAASAACFVLSFVANVHYAVAGPAIAAMLAGGMLLLAGLRRGIGEVGLPFLVLAGMVPTAPALILVVGR